MTLHIYPRISIPRITVSPVSCLETCCGTETLVTSERYPTLNDSGSLYFPGPRAIQIRGWVPSLLVEDPYLGTD